MMTSIQQRLSSHPFVAWLLPRAIILLVVLCALKIGLVLSLQSSLVETHWRLESLRVELFDWINFGVLCGLVFSVFVLFARHSKSAPGREIRWANAALIATGLAFAILSLYRIGWAYLYSVMLGLLSPKDVLHYLILDSFFSQPFLGAYVFGYAFVYWILVRTRREHWSFYILGGIAVLYLCLNLTCLAIPRRALLVVNCFGFASLGSWLISRRTPGAPVLLLPALLLGGTFWMFSTKLIAHGWDEYFILLLSLGLLFFAGIWFATRKSQIGSAVRQVLLFLFVAFVLLANRHYPASHNFNGLLGYALTMPHYFIGELVCVVVAVVLTGLIARVSERSARWTFFAGGAFLIVAAFSDLEVLRALGTRLDWSVLTMSNNPVLAWKSIQPYFASVAWVGALALGSFFVLGPLAATNRVRTLTNRIRAGSLTYVLLAVILLGIAGALAVKRDNADGVALRHVAATSPLAKMFDNRRIGHEQFLQLGQNLALLPPAAQASPSTNSAKRLNVVLVVMESSYNKYLSLFGAADETQPLLKKYRDRMELFPNFYSVFPNSFHARFSVLSGLYPTREYVSSVNPRIESPSMIELLHNAGYTTDVFQSDPREYVGFEDYVRHRRPDNWFDCSNMPGREKFEKVSWGVEEAATLSAMREQITKHRQKNERFFLSYFPVAPHMPFDTPSKEFNKFPTGNEGITQNYTGLYKNQLLYMDWILTSLIDTLAEQQLLEDTIVIITNDHGEMVGDHGKLLGHGWSLVPDLCNTPLIIMNPATKGYRVNRTLGAQVDLLPTLAELLGLSLPAGELYQGQSLYAAGDRTIYLNSGRHRAVIRGSKYILEVPANASATEYSTSVFDISHEGAKTIFKPTTETTDVHRELNDFNRYQNALIAFYSDYRKAFAQARITPKQAVAVR